jgi:hypothetical protein
MMNRKLDPRAIEKAVREFDSLGSQRWRRPDGHLVIEVSSSELARKPWLLWNSFVALLSGVPLEELHPTQRPAWFAYEYDSEVQSGGHAHYFRVRAGAGLDETVDALTVIGAPTHADILRAAVRVWRDGGIAEEHLSGSDRAFAAAQPRLSDVLEAYLGAHRGSFVSLR